MHIPTAKISQTVKDMANITLVIFQLAYLILTLSYFKCQGQGLEYFDWKFLENGDRYGKR